MKITVNANDFCPDDCKMCEIEQETTRFYDYLYVSRECRHKDICKHIYELKGNDNADNK